MDDYSPGFVALGFPSKDVEFMPLLQSSDRKVLDKQAALIAANHLINYSLTGQAIDLEIAERHLALI
jgi:hypothetical protein